MHQNVLPVPDEQLAPNHIYFLRPLLLNENLEMLEEPDEDGVDEELDASEKWF